MDILDCHTHAFPDALAPSAMHVLRNEWKWWPPESFLDGTLKSLLTSMDRAGIRKTFLCSVATRPSQVRKITDWSASIASDRIIPFPSIHPDFDQPEAEIERIAQLGMRGLKFHPQYMECAVDDPRAVRIAKAAAKANLAMVFHAGYDLSFDRDELGSPQQFRRLHELVPDLRILASHMGGWQRWEEALAHLAGLPVYIDTSYAIGQCPQDLFEKILARHPAEYLLFGTDSPWADQTAELAAFRKLPLSLEAQKLALWDNSLRFAGLSPNDR